MKGIVTLQQAKKLAALGFEGEWPQLVYVWIPGGYYALELWRGPQFLMIESPTRYVPDPWYYPAPTLLMAMEFLKEKHDVMWEKHKHWILLAPQPNSQELYSYVSRGGTRGSWYLTASALLDASMEKLEVPA